MVEEDEKKNQKEKLQKIFSINSKVKKSSKKDKSLNQFKIKNINEKILSNSED